MIDSSVNLMSPAKKSKLKSLIKFLFIKEYLELLLLAASILAIFHLGAYFLLDQVVADLAISTRLVNRDFTVLNEEIKTINGRLKLLADSGADFSPVTPWISDIANVVPADIRLTNLAIDRAAGTVTLAGIASTRDSLLAFQKSLGNLPWLATLETPRSQLFQKENISFDISARLKSGIIKGKKPAAKAK